MVSNPILPALVPPRLCDPLDIDADRELVNDLPNSDVKLVLGIRNVLLPGGVRGYGFGLLGSQRP